MPTSNAALVARIEDLCARMDRDYAERVDERRDTKEHREYVHHKLHELHVATEDTRKRMDKVEPVADMVTSWRARLAGALLVLGVIGTLLWTGVTLFRDEVKAIIFGG